MLMTMEDLVQEILKLASEGVYRREIYNRLDSWTTHDKISEAIHQARRRGMYSVPEMRCQRGGTFYQYD